MSGAHGIKNAGKILDVIAEGANVAEAMINDKGGMLSKASKLSSMFDELLALTTLDMSELKNELGELDAEDIQGLEAEFKLKFDISDDKMEGMIEEGLDLAEQSVEFAAKLVAFAKKIKAAKSA